MFNLKEIISSIADVGQKLFKKSVVKKNDLESIISLCDDLISNKGAAFGITVARDITDLYQTLSPEKKLLFFKKINEKFRPSHTKVSEAIDLYKKEQNDKNLFRLFITSEGKRRELFLFEGSEDAIDLENDGAGGNFKYRAQQRRARREKLHRGRIRGSPWSKNYDPEAGVIFYFNKETEQSVYDRPKDIPSEEDVLVEWEEYYHDDNYRYFYVNRVSSKAIWGIPSDIDADFLKIVAKRRARTNT